MTKQEYFEWGQRQARKDWAEGRGFHVPLIGRGWRDSAYKKGYEAAQAELSERSTARVQDSK